MQNDERPPEYEFSQKYDHEHAKKYFRKHDSGFWRRLSTWRERTMVQKALKLAGEPASVLDLPCGTGRFWPTLAEMPGRKIYVADNSQHMIDVGLEFRPQDNVSRIVDHFQCSAFDIPRPDNFVESVISIRLFHHIESSEDRVKLLKELRRVASKTVIFSLWVDGNYEARRHVRNEERKDRERSDRKVDRFLVERAIIEQEIMLAGLSLVGYVDFIKYYSKWRTYVARKV